MKAKPANKRESLENYIDIKHGFAFSSSDFVDLGPYVVLTPGNFSETGGYKDRREKQKFYSGQPPDEYVLKKGDIVVAMTEQATGLLGSTVIIPDGNKFLHNQRIGLILNRCPTHITLKYVYWIFNSAYARKQISATSSGTKVKHTSPSLLKQVVTFIPPLPEQKKIAEILTTWDDGLRVLNQLIEAKQEQKKALMQQLLTGKKRLPGFKGKWKNESLHNLIKQVVRPVAWDDEKTYNLVSVRRNSGGFFFRTPLKGKEIKTKKMFLTKKEDFVISKMQVVHGAMGITPEQFDETHVSGSYITLIPNEDNKIFMPFLDWLSRTPLFYYLTFVSSHGVVIEKMTFVLSEFLKKEIYIPPTLKEQQAIATILDTCDTELALLREQKDGLESQKRGLMQRLLTGQVRVKPDSNPSS